MKKIAIMTDSNSGITQEEGKRIGVSVIPMPFFIDGVEYLEGVNLDSKKFFELMDAGAKVTTSQPSLGMLISMWDELLESNDYVIYIPMTSGLSKSCESAKITAQSEEYEGKVFVVDNHRISLPQAQSVYDALDLAKKGLSPKTIVNVLEAEALNHDIFLMVDTLDYLRKGGRITAAASALGGLLRLKPVLMIKGEKLDSFKMRNRSIEGAKRICMDACLKHSLDYTKDGGEVYYHVAYSGTDNTEALKFAEEIKKEFGVSEVMVSPLALSISCHTGPGALGMAVCKKIPSEINDEVILENKEYIQSGAYVK